MHGFEDGDRSGSNGAARPGTTSPRKNSTSTGWLPSIDYDAMDDPRLSANARMVYGVLCRYADRDRRAFPSQATVARKAAISVRAVRTALKEAKVIGLITSRRRKNGSNIYQLHDRYSMTPYTPMPETEDDSMTELRHPVDKPVDNSEMPAQEVTNPSDNARGGDPITPIFIDRALICSGKFRDPSGIHSESIRNPFGVANPSETLSSAGHTCRSDRQVVPVVPAGGAGELYHLTLPTNLKTLAATSSPPRAHAKRDSERSHSATVIPANLVPVQFHYRRRGERVEAS